MTPTRQIEVIIDANDLHRTQTWLLGRPPSGDRIDYKKIERAAKQLLPDQRGAVRTTRVELFDVERGAGGAFLNPFYDWAEHQGYELHLTPRSRAEAIENESAVLKRLRGCAEDGPNPVMFVGGRCDSADIRAVLLDLADQTDVAIGHFARVSAFQEHELDLFAGSLDIVDDMRAAGAHHYEQLEPDAAIESDRDATPSPPAQPPADHNDTVSIGALGQQLAQLGILRSPAVKKVGDGDRPDPDVAVAAQTPAPAEGCVDQAPPWLIAIDVENVDGVLYEIVDGSFELNADTRVQWQKLRAHFAETCSTSSIAMVPVLQSGPHTRRFASFLDSAGYRPRLIEPESGVKVVDQALLMLLGEMRSRRGNVAVLSNDGDYFEALEALRENPDGTDRRIVVAGFVDRMSQRYLEAEWIETMDLERDLDLFKQALPNRYLPISLDDFDAAALLDECGLFDEDDGVEAA